jgi:hypothetical protein
MATAKIARDPKTGRFVGSGKAKAAAKPAAKAKAKAPAKKR